MQIYDKFEGFALIFWVGSIMTPVVVFNCFKPMHHHVIVYIACECGDSLFKKGLQD